MTVLQVVSELFSRYPMALTVTAYLLEKKKSINSKNKHLKPRGVVVLGTTQTHISQHYNQFYKACSKTCEGRTPEGKKPLMWQRGLQEHMIKVWVSGFHSVFSN